MYRWKHNAKCEQPSLLAFFDTEAFVNRSQVDENVSHCVFRLGVARFGRWNGSDFNATQTLRFDRPAQFWRAINEWSAPKRVMWVFAHNIMFDLTLLGFQERIEGGEIKLSITGGSVKNKQKGVGGSARSFAGFCSIEKGCTLIKCLINGKRVNFCDTYNYYRTTVAELGESVGVHKMSLPTQEDSNETWFARCASDVQIIETAMLGLLREWRANDLGNWQPTVAGLAFSSYRHRFMSRPVVCHGDRQISEIEHDAYYDGRVVPFFLGDVGFVNANLFGEIDTESKQPRPALPGPAYHVDVNSLYPSVMLGNDYPVEAVGNSRGEPIIWVPPSLEWFEQQIKTYLCVATCKIETDKPNYPLRRDGKVIYPIGRFYTTLCTPEINLARHSCHLRGVSSAVFYHRWRLFDKWVDYWWERKRLAELSGNQVRREVCKLLLNSLFGKLGQRNRYWKNTNRWPADYPWIAWPGIQPETSQPISLRSIGYQVQVQHDDGWCRHALVAASAHVTSYARVRMIHDLAKLPKQSCLYQSNDGLLVREDAYQLLNQSSSGIGPELGSYRLCGAYDSVRVWGPRDYEINGCVKKSGLPRDSVRTSERRWSVRQFESSAGMIARPPDSTVRIYDGIVSGSEHHWGQRLTESGWMEPIRVDMW